MEPQREQGKDDRYVGKEEKVQEELLALQWLDAYMVIA